MSLPEPNSFNPPPSMEKSKATDYVNFTHTQPTDKTENTKSKQIADTKLEMENQMNLLSQNSNYPSDTAAEPTGLNAEEFYRNYSNAGAEIPRGSHTNEMMANRALVASYEYSAVRNYEHAMNGLTGGTPFDRYDMNLSSLYASSLSMQRPNITYPPYLNSFNSEDMAQHQKYFSEHSGGDSSTPYYPKPMYHYDSSFPLGGFSAMNLALRTSAVPNPLPIIDLAAPNVTLSNSTTSNTSQYSMAQRAGDNQVGHSIKETHSSHSSGQMNVAGDHNRRRTSQNNKIESFNGPSEHFSAYQESKSPQTEPVDLCNQADKGTTFVAENSTESTQNRPFSRSDSTSDSTASPYIDALKTDSMGEYFSHFVLMLEKLISDGLKIMKIF